MKLTRTACRGDGIFGVLTQDDGDHIAYTLEHSFLQADGTYGPKLNAGAHQCVLGTHKLDHGGPFQAYEIEGVPGHSGILFHIGNFNSDSDGCVLLGKSIITLNGQQALTSSRDTFENFMSDLEGHPSFELVVE